MVYANLAASSVPHKFQYEKRKHIIAIWKNYTSISFWYGNVKSFLLFCYVNLSNKACILVIYYILWLLQKGSSLPWLMDDKELYGSLHFLTAFGFNLYSDWILWGLWWEFPQKLGLGNRFIGCFAWTSLSSVMRFGVLRILINAFSHDCALNSL